MTKHIIKLLRNEFILYVLQCFQSAGYANRTDQHFTLLVLTLQWPAISPDINLVERGKDGETLVEKEKPDKQTTFHSGFSKTCLRFLHVWVRASKTEIQFVKKWTRGVSWTESTQDHIFSKPLTQ